jgi:alpha-L-rhamnosidase
MEELYTGWFEVRNMKGEPNTTVHFQISTTAGKPVEFGMTDSYTFGSSGSGTFRMRFAYHEIRYITITGLKTQPAPSDVVGYRLTSLGKRTGDFSCSSELISAMYNGTVNNYRGLTTGGMTVDCPHRERRGYGGDGHTSYQFALANYPVGAFFNKWTRDFADVQGVSGGFGTPAGTGLVPNTAPTVGGGGGPAWSGFVVTNPWQTYNTFGDTTILEDMYPTMVELLAFYSNATHPTDGLLHPWDSSMWDFLGDWITPHGSEGTVNSPQNLLFNNCYLHYITTLVSKISTILGHDKAAIKYDADASKIASAVNKAFGNLVTGVYLDTLQTHAVMPLASGVVPAAVQDKTMANLANQILVNNSGHLDTGLTGTYFMTKMLMEAGRNDLVFAYANKTDFPSYGYFLSLGYTTWPEQWNVRVGDSLMHGCYNGIGLWFVEGVAGIRVHASESPPLTIRAGVDSGDLTYARGQRVALHGVASSSWALLPSGQFWQNITVPVGGEAKVYLPTSQVGAAGITESGEPLSRAAGVLSVMPQHSTVNKINYLVLTVSSGVYSFRTQWTRV